MCAQYLVIIIFNICVHLLSNCVKWIPSFEIPFLYNKSYAHVYLSRGRPITPHPIPLNKMADISRPTCTNAFSWMKIFESHIFSYFESCLLPCTILRWKSPEVGQLLWCLTCRLCRWALIPMARAWSASWWFAVFQLKVQCTLDISLCNFCKEPRGDTPQPESARCSVFFLSS